MAALHAMTLPGTFGFQGASDAISEVWPGKDCRGPFVGAQQVQQLHSRIDNRYCLELVTENTICGLSQARRRRDGGAP
eukprot:100308-Rhodomonas_salina.1